MEMTTSSFKAATVLPIQGVSFALIACALPFEYNQEITNSRNEIMTKRLMLAIILSNMVCKLTHLIQNVWCIDCVATATIWGNMYAASKVINYSFFIHRAKLAQGMVPIFSRKVFEKVLPMMVVGVGSVYMASLTFTVLTNTKLVCSSYTETQDIDLCMMVTSDSSDFWI